MTASSTEAGTQAPASHAPHSPATSTGESGNPGGPPAEPPAKPLWRNWRFQLLWVGSSTGFLGLTIADFAYPLVILAITGAPAMAALFGFVQTLATMLAGIPAGALVDRFDRRRVLMAVELFRGAATASVFAAWSAGHLTVAHLIAVAALLGAAAPLGMSARMLVLRSVVPPTQLTQALTQDEVRTAIGGLAGPPIGGVLLAVSRALPFLVTTLTYVASFLTALVVRVPVREAAGPASGGGERSSVFAGIREIWTNQVVRTTVLMISVINVGGNALFLAVAVLLLDQGASPRAIGVAVAGEAIGTLLGTPFVARLHRMFSPGKLLIGVGIALTVAVALLAVPLGPWWVLGALSLGMVGVPSIRVLLDVLVLRQVPDERRGRTLGAVMTIFTVGMPVGAIAGGLALQFIGATPTILLVAGVCLISVLIGVGTPALRAARWPEPVA